MRPADFIHPEDDAALRQMESLPGFPTFMKKILSIGFETLQYGVNMASAIRLSEKQLPEIYRHLPPICEKMGIALPEFYLQMDPNPNAWTFGDTRIYITVTSGLVEMMNDEELDAVLAHECGHILCRHVLYHSVAQWIINGVEIIGVINALTIPLQYALLYWYRKSELSADRAACIITSPETVCSVMARLSGGPQSITNEIDMEEWATQADQYSSIRNANMWNKTLQMAAVASLDHPFAAVRVREILKWSQSEQYTILKNAKQITSKDNTHACPHCGGETEDDWQFCRHCGTKL